MRRYVLLGILAGALVALPAVCQGELSATTEAAGQAIGFDGLPAGAAQLLNDMGLAANIDAWTPVAAGWSPVAADWPCIGGDAGLSKYSAAHMPGSTVLRLQYKKRFYGKHTANKGNFFYASLIVTHDGKAMVIADDRNPSPVPTTLSFLVFDWTTGQTETYCNTPWPFWQNPREVDSHHYTNPAVWHSDGRIYMRRGGDHNSTRVYLPDVNQLIPVYNRDAAGTILSNGIDANAFLQVYKDLLLCRYGHTFNTGPYSAYCITEACFVAPNVFPGPPDVLGRQRAILGPSIPDVPGGDGLYGSTGRYGDIPKCAEDVCVLASLVYNNLQSWPDNVLVWLEATDLLTGQTLWTRSFLSCAGGTQGFGTSVSDYWRFVASDSGHYVFFTRAGGQPVTVRVLDLRTGEQVWSKPLNDPLERPLLACHGGYLYVIGRSDQYKLDLLTGQQIWHTDNSWPHDMGYVLGNHDSTSGSTNAITKDPLYRPVVLTDDTLWFVDGDGTASSYAPTAATLIGLRTSDGQVMQQVNLLSYYSSTSHEGLLVVNDVMAADGQIGVLVGVRNQASPYPNSNGMDYQDLYVYRALLPGDIDTDGHVDVVDLLLMIGAWASQIGEPNYSAASDLNNDGLVDAVDLLLLVENFGSSI
jgi:hypothetical protein